MPKKSQTYFPDLDLEKYLLGCILLEGLSAYERVASMNSEMFSEPRNAIIWEVIESLADKNRKTDMMSVKVELAKAGKIDAVGGAAYLAECGLGVAGSSNLELMSFELRQRYAQKQTQAKLKIALQKISGDNPDLVPQVIDDLTAYFLDISKEVVGVREQTMEDVAFGLLERNENLRKGGNIITGIPSGIYELDMQTKGFQPKRLYFFAGRPGHGKTDLAIQIVTHASLNGFPASFFSLEMEKERVLDLAAYQESGCTKASATLPSASENLVSKYNKALGKIIRSDLNILDGGYDLNRLKYAIRQEVRKGAKLIVIDWLMKIQYQQPAGGREDTEIRKLTSGLLALSKECEVPIVMMHQMGREIEKRSSKEPMMSDMFGGSAVEQDADFCGFIVRLEKLGVNQTYKGESTRDLASIFIKKNRGAPLVTLDLYAPQSVGKYYSSTDQKAESIAPTGKRIADGEEGLPF